MASKYFCPFILLKQHFRVMLKNGYNTKLILTWLQDNYEYTFVMLSPPYHFIF